MTEKPVTPYQKCSDTSIKAAREKDASGTTADQDEILLALFRANGRRGVYIFEAAEHLTRELGYPVMPSTASGRINDLMQDEKCQRWFKCDALVVKSKTLPRKENPASGKSAGAYVLKQFESPEPAARGVSQGAAVPVEREAGAVMRTAAPAAAAPVIIESLPDGDNRIRDAFLGESVDPEKYPAYSAWVNAVPPGQPTMITESPPCEMFVNRSAAIEHEAPDAWKKELLESKAGRQIAHTGGRQLGKSAAAEIMQQADFGFGKQLPAVKI